MKILFICGSMEPGRNGVGDYTRRLAAQLIKQGIEVSVIAYNDTFVKDITLIHQEREGVSLPVLRIGSQQLTRRKLLYARKWLKKENPEWVSLQYVPYAFHKKGLPWNLARQLQKLVGSRKSHIMFHELWREPTNLKSKIIARLQRNFIRNLVLKLNPKAIHTSVPVYKERLQDADIFADILPIFSNITGQNHYLNGHNRPFTMVFFSQFDVRESIIQFLDQLIAELYLEKLDFKIILIGEEKPSGTKLKEALDKIPGIDKKIVFSGFLEESPLHKLIHSSDLAISTVPRHLLGKSGSVAAFLSQEIPVAAPFIKPGYEELEIGFYNRILAKAILTTPSLAAFKICKKAAEEMSKELSVQKVAGSLIEDLGIKKYAKPVKVSSSISSN